MVLFRGCKNTKKIEVQELKGQVLFNKIRELAVRRGRSDRGLTIPV
jgi:hypothetical protein